MRFGLSTITADRFFGKALRSRHAIHRQLADELANACPPIEHTQLILTITDAPIGEVTLDLDDEIGIINVGRDSSLSYAPKDNPSGNALDAFYAACWHAAIDAYPNFDAGGRSKLHAIVDDWQKGSANKSLQQTRRSLVYLAHQLRSRYNVVPTRSTSGGQLIFCVSGMDVHTAMNVAGSAPVTVEGVLLVGADSRLVADHADPPGAAILLPHEATEHCLLSRVPAYGGGPHIYHERAVVTGRIVEAPWRFATVDELTVIREGETYHFESVFPLHR